MMTTTTTSAACRSMLLAVAGVVLLLCSSRSSSGATAAAAAAAATASSSSRRAAAASNAASSARRHLGSSASGDGGGDYYYDDDDGNFATRAAGRVEQDLEQMWETSPSSWTEEYWEVFAAAASAVFLLLLCHCALFCSPLFSSSSNSDSGDPRREPQLHDIHVPPGVRVSTAADLNDGERKALEEPILVSADNDNDDWSYPQGGKGYPSKERHPAEAAAAASAAVAATTATCAQPTLSQVNSSAAATAADMADDGNRPASPLMAGVCAGGSESVSSPISANGTKSSKHRKVEELRDAGHPIRIMGESEFRNLLSGSNAI